MSSVPSHSDSENVAERAERRWAVVSVLLIVIIAVAAAVAGIRQATMPQPRVEAATPGTMKLGGEFVESNLGSALEPDGSVTVRAVGQQYSFTPQCMLVPTDALITFRATSADVVHGFLIEGTNVNTMLVPGYISNITARFAEPGERLMPCHEFCGMGHHGMWAKVRVIDRKIFDDLASKSRRLSCVAQ
jgi:cytochrome c oxidase subunit 2